MNDEVKLCECIAVEDDWLDISYTQRHYIEDEQDALMLVRTSVFKKRKKALNNAKKWITRCFVAIFIIATIVAMRFVEDGFMGEVFATAKQSYSQNVIQVISQSQQKQSTINLPINVTVDKVDNGTVIVSGGKVLLNFKKGKVLEANNDTVTVSVNENLQIVYSGLTKILVSVGDEVGEQAVLGKYVNTATVNLLYDGEVVKDITTVNYSLVWKI